MECNAGAAELFGGSPEPDGRIAASHAEAVAAMVAVSVVIVGLVSR